MDLPAPPATPSTTPPAKVEMPTEPQAPVPHEQSISEKRGDDGSKPAEGQKTQTVSASSKPSTKDTQGMHSESNEEGQSKTKSDVLSKDSEAEHSAISNEPMEVDKPTSPRQTCPEKPGRSLDDRTGARSKQNQKPTHQMDIAKLQDTREVVLSPELEQVRFKNKSNNL